MLTFEWIHQCTGQADLYPCILYPFSDVELLVLAQLISRAIQLEYFPRRVSANQDIFFPLTLHTRELKILGNSSFFYRCWVVCVYTFHREMCVSTAPPHAVCPWLHSLLTLRSLGMGSSDTGGYGQTHGLGSPRKNSTLVSTTNTFFFLLKSSDYDVKVRVR